MKEKFCWLAQEYRKGWKLGFCIGNDKPLWLRNVLFSNEKECLKALKGNIVFVHLKKVLLLFLIISLSGCVSMSRYNKDMVTVARVGQLRENTYTLKQIDKLEKTEIQKDNYFILKSFLQVRKLSLETELIFDGVDSETIRKIEK